MCVIQVFVQNVNYKINITLLCWPVHDFLGWPMVWPWVWL